MPMHIKTIQQYLYEKQRDLLLLKLRSPNSEFLFDGDDEETQKIENQHINWFKDRGIEFYRTCDQSVISGWLGEYYIDVDPTNDIVNEYSTMFETTDGNSLNPLRYQMYIIDYKNWIDEGGDKIYEQHLKDMEDSNYNP